MEGKKESHSSAFLGKNQNLSVGKVRIQTDHHKDGDSPMKDYILIKLRSGEEIIASLMSKNRNGLKVLRPMQIRQVPFVDYASGSLKAAVVMENWIGRTNENEVTIPNNWIGIKMLPSQEAIDAYEKQMKNEDTPAPPKKEEPVLTDKEKKEFEALENEMTKMLSSMASDAGISPPDIEGMNSFSSAMDEQSKNKEMVIVNFMFPANIFKNMMEEGLIEDFLTAGMSFQDDNGDDSDEDLEDDTDPKPRKKKQIRENDVNLGEKGDESWGNSFRDWSSNPSDYL